MLFTGSTLGLSDVCPYTRTYILVYVIFHVHKMILIIGADNSYQFASLPNLYMLLELFKLGQVLSGWAAQLCVDTTLILC